MRERTILYEVDKMVFKDLSDEEIHILVNQYLEKKRVAADRMLLPQKTEPAFKPEAVRRLILLSGAKTRKHLLHLQGNKTLDQYKR